MYEIEKFPCNDKNEAHTRERYWIENLNAGLNKQIPTRTRREYYEDNRSELIEKAKEYSEENKEKVKEKVKKWSGENKDKVLGYQKKYYENNKQLISDKKKIYKKINKQTISEKNKQYKETNKQAISEKNKIKFTCDCGSSVVICSKQRHNRSIKHIKYIESTK
jgi:hypothetical protein